MNKSAQHLITKHTTWIYMYLEAYNTSKHTTLRITFYHSFSLKPLEIVALQRSLKAKKLL